MTNANDAIKPLHDRMPVFLFENEWDKWMSGSFDDLLAFQARKFPNELIEMERTPELWVKKRTKEARQLRSRRYAARRRAPSR